MFLLKVILSYLLLSCYFQSINGDNKNECQSEKNCPKTFSCFASPFFPSKCTPPREKDLKCEKIFKGETVPDHQICIDNQVKIDNLKGPGLSVFRCFKSKESFKCQNAYLNYCVIDYSMKEPINDVCPPNFDCVSREFKDGKAKVCIPNKFDEFGTCKSDFDCGFSTVTQAWIACLNGKCEPPIQ